MGSVQLSAAPVKRATPACHSLPARPTSIARLQRRVAEALVDPGPLAVRRRRTRVHQVPLRPGAAGEVSARVFWEDHLAELEERWNTWAGAQQ